jgi:hypothetical protein
MVAAMSDCVLVLTYHCGSSGTVTIDVWYEVLGGL